MVRTACLIIVLSLMAIADGAAAAERPSDEGSALRRALQLFPADTETVLAAPRVQIPGPDEIGSAPDDMTHVARMLAFGELAVLEQGRFLAPLSGLKADLVIRGGRSFETVSSFGSHRSEGCVILLLEKPLSEKVADRWTTMLRKEADSILRFDDRDVFVFPSTVDIEIKSEPKAWEATYVTMLARDVLLCATSDNYLKEILARADATPDRRALPEDLLEWRQLDIAAPVWMIRHVPARVRGRSLDGITWIIEEDELRVVYDPAQGMAASAEKLARRRWDPDVIELGAKVQRERDGTITVRWGIEKFGPGNDLVVALNLYALQAESGESLP